MRTPALTTTPTRIADRLLTWYDRVRRELPFRNSRDPYAIWVSEVMLQQTQVSTVLPYFERWMQRFPTVERLAEASEDEVLSQWQGLGYYSRARSLRRAAQAVVSEHAGRLPNHVEQLLALPGIGPYSAGAIASIAYGERVPLVDGNVVRVLCRLFGWRGDPARAPLKKLLWERAGELVPAERPGDFNQALMELGATVCTPTKPRCAECPLSKLCVAREQALTEQLPELAKRAETTEVPMVALVFRKKERFGVWQLPADARRWASMWQFPVLERGADEAALDTVQRIAQEFLGTRVRAAEPFLKLRHSVTRYRIVLDAYRADAPARVSGASRLEWKTHGELAELALPSAHRRLATALAKAERT